MNGMRKGVLAYCRAITATELTGRNVLFSLTQTEDGIKRVDEILFTGAIRNAADNNEAAQRLSDKQISVKITGVHGRNKNNGNTRFSGGVRQHFRTAHRVISA
ncbi:hypothetical protein V6L80_00080 (plasmid) [Erwinia persicina]|uniref:hypothetical protein n=1 Tax=Erwinia persicina TaxID=55211 RepID=UPI0030D165E4